MSELKIKSGNRALQKSLPAFIFNRFFVGSPGGGLSRHLVWELFKATRNLSDVEIVSMPAPEGAPFGLVADESVDQIFNLRSFYPGLLLHEALRRKTGFITPINLSAAPNLFKSRAIPVHVALIQVSPPPPTSSDG